MSKIVKVELGDRSYPIWIGSGLPAARPVPGPKVSRALIVSDSHVAPLYGSACRQWLAARGVESRLAVVPAGEKSKSLARVKYLYDQAFSAGLDRSSLIVALGGGMVGDLAGFVAATFLRGIRFIQVPTTLLAMVDSSVGGKTGVNVKQGKNLVGAFYQPEEVVADLKTLTSLPDREYASGLAEVVKYGIICDAPFFVFLEKNAGGLRRRDKGLLEEVVERCCKLKARVVNLDERESGLRAILNFGHTFGHAIEKTAGYGTWLHGEAVSAGMVFASALSVKTRKLPVESHERIKNILNKLGLPIGLGGLKKKTGWQEVRRAMGHDKKTLGNVPRFVLVPRIGRTVIGDEVPEAAMKDAFREMACH